MKKGIYLLSLLLTFSVIFASCKKDDDVKKENEVENNGNNGNNNGGSGNGNTDEDGDGGTGTGSGSGDAKNNTVIGHTGENIEGQLTNTHAWKAFGDVYNLSVRGKYDKRSGAILTITLGPGEFPSADRSYELQGIVFTAKSEKAFIKVEDGTDAWYSAASLGGKLYAKVNGDGSVTFYFDNLTFESSVPPYRETKVFSGKFTLPVDFDISSSSKPVLYDLAD